MYHQHQHYQPRDAGGATEEMDYTNLDNILENEKDQNRKESWNKIDRGLKLQKLQVFAEKYGNDHSLSEKEIANLKLFFAESINKNKLQKTKEVIYDKTTGTVTNVPALCIHCSTRAFTLKNMDTKRVSTLKSLTPKRIIVSAAVSTSVHSSQIATDV